MNREIKFRGLNTKGECVYGSLISNCTGLEHMPKQNTKTWIVTSAFGHGGWFNVRGREYVLPETVGQSTGMIDYQNNELFCGDLVSCMGEIWVIEWDNSAATFIYQMVNKIGSLGMDEFSSNADLLLIGNKVQNPELLK